MGGTRTGEGAEPVARRSAKPRRDIEKNCAVARFRSKFEKHRSYACFFRICDQTKSHFAFASLAICRNSLAK